MMESYDWGYYLSVQMLGTRRQDTEFRTHVNL